MGGSIASDISRRADDLRAHGVEILCGVIADSGGVIRAKAVPAKRIEQFATAGMGASLTWPVFCVDSWVAMTPEIGVVGDLRLVTDLQAAVVLAGGLGWAPADVYDQEGNRSDLCWRGAAARQTSRLASHGVQTRTGFELEFTLFDEDGTRLGDATGWTAYGLEGLSTQSEFAADVAERLDRAGVPAEQIHAEYGTGQFEVSLPPTTPVAAADAAVLARAIICRAARDKHLRASFSPMPIPGGSGNGAHVHLSFATDEGPVLSGGDGPAGLTGLGHRMVGGVVDGLPDSIAVLAGSVVSGDRLKPDHWAGAFSCWGVENREAAVRFIVDNRGNPGGANMEVKCVDAAANPYLTVGILLGLAANGLEDTSAGPEPVQTNPAGLSAEDARRTRTKPLPDSPESALKAFETSETIRAILGASLHAAVTAVRRHEISALAQADVDWHALTRFSWSA